jgi:hypothetical protein
MFCFCKTKTNLHCRNKGENQSKNHSNQDYSVVSWRTLSQPPSRETPLLSIAHHPSFIIHYLLFIIHNSLFIIYTV